MDALTLNYFDISWFSSKDGPGTRVVLFLQGCHQCCPWCHSPQSWELGSPLLFFASRCQLCGACVLACPHAVHSIVGHQHQLDRSRCNGCGQCIKACPVSRGGKWNTNALGRTGIAIEPGELFQLLKPQLELLKDIGGLTVSGGEPLLQYHRLAQLLTLCKQARFHTAIETSAALPRRHFQALIDVVDHWLFGIRPIHMDRGRIETIGSWELILSNLEFLAARNSQNITVRAPIIPGYTDKIPCFQELSHIMARLHLRDIEILPFNPMASLYYEALGIPFPMQQTLPPDNASVNHIVEIFASRGFSVKIVQ